jgi:membrane protein implicated in regulation of membrane protease activity
MPALHDLLDATGLRVLAPTVPTCPSAGPSSLWQFGGWANAWQGIASAAVASLVSVAVAFWVLRRTLQDQRAALQEQLAEQRAAIQLQIDNDRGLAASERAASAALAAEERAAARRLLEDEQRATRLWELVKESRKAAHDIVLLVNEINSDAHARRAGLMSPALTPAHITACTSIETRAADIRLPALHDLAQDLGMLIGCCWAVLLCAYQQSDLARVKAGERDEVVFGELDLPLRAYLGSCSQVLTQYAATGEVPDPMPVLDEGVRAQLTGSWLIVATTGGGPTAAASRAQVTGE